MKDPLVLGKAAQRVAALHPELPPMQADFTVMVKPGTEIFVLTATSPSAGLFPGVPRRRDG